MVDDSVIVKVECSKSEESVALLLLEHFERALLLIHTILYCVHNSAV